MKKYFLIVLSLAVIAACKQGTGKGASAPKDETKAETAVETKAEEKPMQFVSSLERGPSGDYEFIKVTGTRGNEAVWSTQLDLYSPMDDDEVSTRNWLSYEDVNFDGTPDLLVYLGLNTYGRVEEFYQAFLLSPDKEPEYVEGYCNIANPEVDPEAKEIRGYTKTGPYEITTTTLKWENGELILSDEKTEIFLDDEDLVSYALEYYHTFEEADGVSIDRWASIDVDGDGYNELWLSDFTKTNGAIIALKGGMSIIGFTDYQNYATFGDHGVKISGPCGGPCYQVKVVKLDQSLVTNRLELITVYGEPEECNLDGKDVSMEKAEAFEKSVIGEPHEPEVKWNVF